ncbi:MAG: hypothetical protein VB085_08975 [Peptococcaceae bacterium]|nr:hypothetical protein [Peptococcaceae bacterium]
MEKGGGRCLALKKATKKLLELAGWMRKGEGKSKEKKSKQGSASFFVRQ